MWVTVRGADNIPTGGGRIDFPTLGALRKPMQTLPGNSKEEERNGTIGRNKRSKKNKGYLHRKNVQLDGEGKGIGMI